MKSYKASLFPLQETTGIFGIVIKQTHCAEIRHLGGIIFLTKTATRLDEPSCVTRIDYEQLTECARSFKTKRDELRQKAFLKKMVSVALTTPP